MTTTKLRINWPTLISSLFQFLAFTIHPFLTHHVLTTMGFSFPATLAFTQVAVTAVCLWFWSIFGLFHVRSISLKPLFLPAISAAVLALLAVSTLARTSLLVFQTARLLSAAFVLAVRTDTPSPLPLALLSAVFLVFHHHPADLVIPLCYAIFTAVNALFLHPVVANIKASEIQLQLLLRSLASLLLTIPVMCFDVFPSDDDSSILHFTLADSAIVLVFSTGLVAFVSFTSSRATTHRLSAEMHNLLLLAANLAVFICHFVTQEEHMLAWHPLGVLGLAASWWFLAEKRRRCLESYHVTDDATIPIEGV